MVRPLAEYASTVWSPHTHSSIHKVEMVQRRAARWVTNNYTHDSVTQMIQNLGWRSLEDRRTDARLIMFHKIVHGLVAIHLPSYLRHPLRLTRHMHPLTYIQIHTSVNFYKYSYFPCTVVLWNNLPYNVAVLSELEQFKRAVHALQYSRP